MITAEEFDPAKAGKGLPCLEGKVILITGGTSGLGKACVEALMQRTFQHLYFIGRQVQLGRMLVAGLERRFPDARENVTFLQCDLGDLQQVRGILGQFQHDRLDVLICNAGVMAPPPSLTQSGCEIQFAVNHIGHAALIQDFLPILLSTATITQDVRIVFVTSKIWKIHPKGGIDLETLTTQQTGRLARLDRWKRFGQSKLANIIFARELASRYDHAGISVVSCHPGVIRTRQVRNLDRLDRLLMHIPLVGRMVTLEEGIRNQLWLAVGATKDQITNGGYYLPVGVLANRDLDKDARSPNTAVRLWAVTNERIGAWPGEASIPIVVPNN